MSESQSLFARKLKEHRLLSGRHGRMTQEQLADMLEVSLEAVSKYERSLSFMRGDLEHRLVERLGWSQDAVLACREDWAARRSAEKPVYRIMDDEAVDQHFGGCWRRASDEAVRISFAALGDLPDVLAAERSVYATITSTFRDMAACVLHDGAIVAQWVVLPLLPEDEANFRACRFDEQVLSVERVNRPILPGEYFGYCPALIVAPGHERATSLLMSSFVAHLEDLVARGVLYRGIGTVSCTAAGAQLCRHLGMERLGAYEPVLGNEVWELPGARIATSLFAQRSARVREAYGRAFL